MPPPIPLSRRDWLHRAVALALLPGLARSLADPRFGAVAPNEPSLLQLARDPLLAAILYNSPSLKNFTAAPDGAVGMNAAGESAQPPKWFIEIQRLSGDLIQAGIGSDNEALIQRALPIIRWGFNRQSPAGDFPGEPDEFHSTEIFVADTARGLVLLRDARPKQFAALSPEFVPKITAAARWLIQPDVAAKGQHNNAPFTHRNYILAAALGLTAELSGDAELAAHAAASASAGLALQRPDGVNPERGGFDANYQSAGLLFASRYYPTCHNLALRGQLRAMLTKGLAWLSGRIANSGEIETAGSTRTGIENLRWGKLKTVNYMELVQTLCHGSRIIGDATLRTKAENIARRYGPIGPDQLA